MVLFKYAYGLKKTETEHIFATCASVLIAGTGDEAKSLPIPPMGCVESRVILKGRLGDTMLCIL